jgi:hypothetical protein
VGSSPTRGTKTNYMSESLVFLGKSKVLEFNNCFYYNFLVDILTKIDSNKAFIISKEESNVLEIILEEAKFNPILNKIISKLNKSYNYPDLTSNNSESVQYHAVVAKR